MASLNGRVNYPSTNLTASTTYNVFCGAAPAHQRICIRGYAFYGTANGAQTPGTLNFCSATSQGTTGTTMTPQPIDEDTTETFQSSWIYAPGVAPSGITIIDARAINPQISVPEVFRHAYVIKGGGFFVVQFIPQFTGNYFGWLDIEE